MTFKHILLGTLFVVAACSPRSAAVHAEKVPVVSENQITEIIACIKADKCNAPVETVKVSDGDIMHMVTVGATSGYIYHYFYTDNQRFGVVISDPEANIMLVEDNDLNGKVDRFGGGSKSMKPREVPVTENDKGYVSVQGLYIHAMSLVDQVVPKPLRDSIEKLPST